MCNEPIGYKFVSPLDGSNECLSPDTRELVEEELWGSWTYPLYAPIEDEV